MFELLLRVRSLEELMLPELVNKPVRVRVKSSSEKISPPLFVETETRFSLEFPRIFPALAMELLAAICASFVAKIVAFAWLLIVSALMFAEPSDLIVPELVIFLLVKYWP